MGYEIKLKINELDSKFKTNMREPVKDDQIEKQKQIFISWLMNVKVDINNNMFVFENLYKDFDFQFRWFTNFLEENWKYWVNKQLETDDDWTKKNEIIFCGWDKSSPGDGEKTIGIIELYKESIWYKISIIPFVDYFENEDNWHKKFVLISDLIHEYTESYFDAMSKDFVDFYRDNQVKWEEDNEDEEYADKIEFEKTEDEEE